MPLQIATELPEGESAIQSLEAFAVHNEELEQLEAMLARFNLFEAIGARRMELRHSDFLAFLLDPQENHGLGDLFIRKLLQKVLAGSGRYVEGIRPVHLDVMDLSATSVSREWQNIDILCVNTTNQLVVLIENKIESAERPGQLEKYFDVVKHTYGNFRVVPLFLTPDGIDPTDDRYIAVDYSFVCDALAYVLRTRQSVMGVDVFTTITHYVEMLRRHVVSESEIADLARRIYGKHRTALEIIFEHRPDAQWEWNKKLQELVKRESQLELDKCDKGHVRFCPHEWDFVAELKKGEGWTPSKRVLLLEFRNRAPDSIKLCLVVGPTESGFEEIRQSLFRLSQSNSGLFRGAMKSLSPKWSMIRSHGFLNRNDFESSDGDSNEELDEKLEEKWGEFLSQDLPLLISTVKRAFAKDIQS